MNKILLIDADSTIPNLALMKLSTYHKSLGDSVELVKLNLPYYPNRKKKGYLPPTNYNKIYCSVIFEGNTKCIKRDNIIFGGTGYDLTTTLPDSIEHLKPDYSIYPDNDISYGFISRGCLRNCYFCKVPEKEGYIHQVNTIDSIVNHKTVKFMDNNFLALPNHKELLQELIDKKIKCQFNQGLDIRLVDKENSILLSKLNYLGNYIFALDDYRYLNIIEKKLNILNWRKDWEFKFFVYIHPDMPVENTIKRIEYLKLNKCLPYIMRDIKCWDSVNNRFYVDIASWCNQVNIFKKMTFEQFLYKRHPKNKENRINKSILLSQSQGRLL